MHNFAFRYITLFHPAVLHVIVPVPVSAILEANETAMERVPTALAETVQVSINSEDRERRKYEIAAPSQLLVAVKLS